MMDINTTTGTHVYGVLPYGVFIETTNTGPSNGTSLLRTRHGSAGCFDLEADNDVFGEELCVHNVEVQFVCFRGSTGKH